MSYTFSGVATDTSGTTTSTASFGIGAVAGPNVILGLVLPGIAVVPTVTIGGVALSNAVQVNDESFIFWGPATGLSGTQTVTVVAAGSAFQLRSYCLWYTTDTLTLGNTGSTNGGTNFTLGVNAGQYLFAIGASTTSPLNFDASTQLPTADHPINTVGSLTTGADWLISATNAAFTVQPGAGGGNFSAAAAFTPSSPPAVTIIGIGSSAW